MTARLNLKSLRTCRINLFYSTSWVLETSFISSCRSAFISYEWAMEMRFARKGRMSLHQAPWRSQLYAILVVVGPRPVVDQNVILERCYPKWSIRQLDVVHFFSGLR